ncbi:MAG: hypothetical protein JNM93_11360, partial [Bacteriovoracaceae bacterium]|nr:hypothetical protein [Bacteriovoracaceae bacterium]
MFLSVLLYSCSGKQTDTVFVMNVGNLVTGADSDGGVMVWGHNQTLGDRMGFNVTPANDIVSLKNGTWKFWAVSWDGGLPMVGNTKCAVVTTDIGGGAQEVNMSLATANCTASEFADTNYTGGTQFDDTQFEICQFGDTLSTTCNLASFGSFRVSLPSYQGSQIQNLGLNKCFTGNSGSGLKIPAGKFGLALPFKVDIHLYPAGNTTCTGASYAIMPFNTGLANGVPTAGHSYSDGNAGAAINTVRVKKSLAITAPVFNNINSSGTVVTSNDNIPEINFSNVTSGDVVKIYTSIGNCTANTGDVGSAVATGPSVAVYTSSGLTEAVYNFYAKKIDSSSNVSNCISAGTYTLDMTGPSVTINQAGAQADPALTLPIVYDVSFSEPINPATFIVSDLITTGTATWSTMNWTITNSGNDRDFVVTLTMAGTSPTTDGSLFLTLSASMVSDVAGNPNTASSSTDNQVYVNFMAPALASGLAWASPVMNVTSGLVANWTRSVEADSQDFILYTNAGCTTLAGYQQLGLTGVVESHTFNITQSAGTEMNYYFKIVTHDGYGRSSSTCSGSPIEIDLQNPNNATILGWDSASPSNSPSGKQAQWTASTSTDIVEQQIQFYKGVGGCLGTPYGSLVTGLSSVASDYAVMLSDNDENYYEVTTVDNAGNFSVSPCSPVMEIDSLPPNLLAINTPMSLYKTGDTLNINLIFDEQTNVVGMPELDFVLGDRNRKAIYVSGSGTTQLTFSYIVEIGDYDSDNDIETVGLPLTGGSYQDALGNMSSNIGSLSYFNIKINGMDNG